METAVGEGAEERKKEEERRGQIRTFLLPSSEPFPVFSCSIFRRSFIDPICCNFCMVLSMCDLGWFCQLFIFSARHQLDTWTLAPQKTRGMT